jgi:hypothetical protein
MVPVPKDVVHGEAAGRAAGLAGLGRGVGKGEPVVALGVQIPLVAVGLLVGRAARALGRELPVGAVGAGTGLEDLVGRARVGLGEGVGAGAC